MKKPQLSGFSAQNSSQFNDPAKGESFEKFTTKPPYDGNVILSKYNRFNLPTYRSQSHQKTQPYPSPTDYNYTR